MGPQPAPSDSWTMWGECTLSMLECDSASSELPRATSGSKELSSCPGVVSTWIVATSSFDCDCAGCAHKSAAANNIDVSLSFMRMPQMMPWQFSSNPDS